MTDALNVPNAAVDLTKEFEGEVLHPYQDSAGVWTIGIGSIWDWRNNPPTRVMADTAPVDDATARAWMVKELTQAAETVTADVHVPLTDNQRAALEDFVFNLGAGNFAASSLLRYLNEGQYEAAAVEFDKWDHAGGVELAGLLRRRQAETDLFNTKSV